MRILAIDTALEACAAGVVETPERVLAQESLAMARGHAEALMPLLARVMDQASLGFPDLATVAFRPPARSAAARFRRFVYRTLPRNRLTAAALRAAR